MGARVGYPPFNVCGGTFLKVALAVWAVVMLTEEEPVPVPAPLQPVSVEPLAATENLLLV